MDSGLRLAARPGMRKYYVETPETPPMYIAMNRFRVAKGSEADFEQVWLTRDTHLDEVPGFVEFHLLKGPEAEDHTLYASHTVWANFAAFEAWTKSEAFRKAHHKAGDNKPLYLGHPQFEGFEVKQTVARDKKR
jgi:heme-degrading monooxygenase HmoA